MRPQPKFSSNVTISSCNYLGVKKVINTANYLRSNAKREVRTGTLYHDGFCKRLNTAKVRTCSLNC